LFFGKNMSRTRATGGLVEALESHGLDVKWMNMATLRRWLGPRRALSWARGTFERYSPDLVFVFCRDLPLELLREFRRTVRTVIWVEEPLDDIGQAHVDYFAEAHAVFMTNPSKFEWLRERGVAHTSFVMDAFSSSFHYPVSARDQLRDVVFIGGPGREGQRAEFLAEVARHVELEIYGRGWQPWRRRYPWLRVRGSVRAPAYRRLCATSRIVLGLNQVNDDPLYFSNRTFFSLGCKGFHLTHYVPQLETVFTNGEHLAWYDGLDDCLVQIFHYLARPDERDRIANAGYELVCASHQFRARVAEILRFLASGQTSAQPEIVIPRALPDPGVVDSLTAAPLRE
jgi:spore maturation protein CgeB